MVHEVFTYVIEEIMINSVTDDDFNTILTQIKQLNIDSMNGILLNHSLQIITSEQRFVEIAKRNNVSYEIGERDFTEVNMKLEFDKALLKRLFVQEGEIEEDEDDLGIKLALSCSAFCEMISNAMGRIITKYE